jgi:hypothetical protein
MRQQLKRLEIFGVIDEQEKALEYERVLDRFTTEQLRLGINKLVETYDRRGYPHPSDIICAIRAALGDPERKPRSYRVNEKCGTEIGSGEMNSSYWRTFRLCGALKQPETNRYFEKASQCQYCRTDAESTAYLDKISTEIETLLGVGSKIDKKEIARTQATQDEELPF